MMTIRCAFAWVLAVGVAGLLGPVASHAQQSSKITIGAILPLTGAGAQYGTRMQQGIELALAQINASGGVQRSMIEIAYADTGDQPSNGPAALRRFKQLNDVPFTLISNSNVTLASIPVAEELKIVLINGGGQSDRLLGASRWLYSNIPASLYETSVLADWVAKNIGKESIVTQQTDPIGQSAGANWQKFYTSAGGKIIAQESVAFEQADYRSVLTKLRAPAAQANVWFIAGTYGEDAKRLITQARTLGIATRIASASVTVTTLERGNPAYQGIVHTQLRAQPTPAFIDAFKSKYGAEPEFYSAAYYNGVMIFAKALEHAIAKGYGRDGEAIRRAIDEIRTFDVGGGRTDFNEQNSTVSGLEVVEIQADGTRKVLARP